MGVNAQDVIDAFARGDAPDGYVWRGDLKIAHRPDLRRLPRGLSVRQLEIEDCPALEELPDGLTVKQHVEVKGCPGLRRIGRGVRVGWSLDVSDCASLEELPDDLWVGGTLSVGPAIRSFPAGIVVGHLDLRSARALRAVPAGVRAASVRLPAHVEALGEDLETDRLCAERGSLLGAIPASARITSSLELPGARRIEALPALREMDDISLPGSALVSVSELHAQREIDFTGCTALISIDGPVHTKTLRITGCTRIERIERIEVDKLDAVGCTALRRISASTRVARFADLFGCKALEAIDLETPPSELLILGDAAQLDLLRPSVRSSAAVPVAGTGAPLGEPRILPIKAEHIAFSPSSSRLATLSPDALAAWESSGEHIATVTPPRRPRCVEMSPDGEVVAVGAGFHHDRQEGRDFCLWDLRRGELVSLGGLSDDPLLEVHRVGFSPDGLLVAASDRSGHVLVVDVATRTLVEERAKHEWPFATTPRLEDERWRARRLRDGRELRVLDGRVFLVDPSGERPHVFAVVSAGAEASADVSVAERAGVIAACARDGAVKLLDLSTLAPLAEGHASPGANRIEVTEDARVVAVATPEDVRVYQR